jgi:hypothetical protein
LPELDNWLSRALAPDQITEPITAMQQAAEKGRRGTQRQKGQVLGDKEIAALVRKADDLRTAIPRADPREKERLYERLGLKMTYHPSNNEIQADIRFAPDYADHPNGTIYIQGRFDLQ